MFKQLYSDLITAGKNKTVSWLYNGLECWTMKREFHLSLNCSVRLCVLCVILNNKVEVQKKNKKTMSFD